MDSTCIYEHYRAVAQAVPDYPIYVYNIPPNVKNAVGADVLARLNREFPNVIGVKDSSGDFMNFINYQQAVPKGLCALMGNDAQIYSALAIGGSGAVAATATALPEPVVAIYDNWLRGDHAKALEAQDKVIKLRALFRSFTPIAPYKKVLEWRGIRAGIPRLPLRDLTEAESNRLRSALAELGYSFSPLGRSAS
jgi:4-hydroxy-tetrahydrodipicolinate synthase